MIGGVTGLVVLGGAAGAVAATQGSGGSGRQAYLADLAQRLDVSPSTLTAAMRAAASDRVDAALAAGRITQAQANAIKQRIAQGGGGRLFGHRLGRGVVRDGIAVAAQYLGITPATLRSDVQSGKSAAEIASSTPGKSVAGLTAAITAAATTRLDQLVSRGVITSQQEQQLLATLPARLDTLLQRTGGR